MFTGAITSLESRLDTILADEQELAAKQRATEQALTTARSGRSQTVSGKLDIPPGKSSNTGSIEASRTRVNDRLAERLAKATAQKAGGSQVGSNVPSRVVSPAIGTDSASESGESKRSGEVARSVPAIEDTAATETDELKIPEPGVQDEVETHGHNTAKPETDGASTLLNSGLPINPAKISLDSSRPSVETNHDTTPDRISIELANGHTAPAKSATDLEAEMAQMRDDYAAAQKQRQVEMHANLERIDALQAKLKYLAEETVAAAKEANASVSAGSAEAKLAGKDERIALLMEEGEKLSKTELKHLQTIKKLRAKTSEDEKAALQLRTRLQRAERAESELKQKLRRAETAERQASEKTKAIAAIEQQVDELRTDRENASELIRTLTSQLKEAKDQADRAQKESKTSEADRNRIATLENELEDAQIEKKLAEDRAAAEITKAKEDLSRQAERFAVSEMELKNEVANLESRLEAMRARAEEASSDAGAVGGESSVKLMRQVEMLQSQHSLAKENWESIEGSLNARLIALEKGRDDANKREADVRKRARDAGVKSRKAEEELEAASEEARSLTQELRLQKEEVKSLQASLERAEAALSEARADFERQRRVWDAEVTQRIEAERTRWQRSVSGHHIPGLRNDSPAVSSRKASLVDTHARPPARTRITSHDLANIHTEHSRPVSRRSSAMPTPLTASTRHVPSLTPDRDHSPVLSRQESMLSMDTDNIPPTPSIEVDQDFDTGSSPNRTINDLVSTSTAGAGPSVQLVERMSAAVRRLESEKAASKDELARLSAQRDDARNEVVTLMREVERTRDQSKRVVELEGEIKETRGRYEASLEMLGEREEEVEELRQDVAELKKMYRELVEEKVGGR